MELLVLAVLAIITFGFPHLPCFVRSDALWESYENPILDSERPGPFTEARHRTAAMLAIATDDSHGFTWIPSDRPGILLFGMQAAIDAGATRVDAIAIVHDLISEEES